MEYNDVLKKYQPLINSTVNRFSGSTIPKNLLRLQAEILVGEALNTFDPQKGPLANHVSNYMKSMNRFVNEASPIYIPEERSQKFGKFTSEVATFEEKVGRKPTYEEMADRLKMGIGDIKRLSEETGRKLTSDISFADNITMAFDPTFNEKNFLDMVYNKLENSDEKKILALTYGIHGYPRLSTNEQIAQRVGVSESTIRRKKDNIITVMRKLK